MEARQIVFTVTNDLSYDRRMQRICRCLALNNFDVTLVGRKLAKSIPISNEPYKQKRLTCVFNKGKLFYIEYNIRLFFFLLFTNYDVYSAVDLDTIMPNFIVAGIKGKKRYYDAHEYFSEVPEVVDRKTVKKTWEWIAKKFIPKADVAYTVGPELAKLFSQRYNKHFDVIRNVPDKFVLNEPLATGTYLLYQGALNKGRGLEELILAMHDIAIPLKIAGEGDLSEDLRILVKAQGLTDKIEFLGMVQPHQLTELTVGAYIGLNILENKGLSYYYSLANKFFDYIQAGVPSINMDFPEYSAIINKYKVGLLIPNIDVKTISDSVNTLINDKVLYLKMAEECIKIKLIYNWGQEQDKLLNLYQV